MPGFGASGRSLADANYRLAIYDMNNRHEPVGLTARGLARLRWTTRQVVSQDREAVRRDVLVGPTDAVARAGQGARADHLLGGDPLWLTVISALPSRQTGATELTMELRPGTPPGG